MRKITKRTARRPAVVLKRVVRGRRRPFKIIVPELKPGQGVATRVINVPVRISHGLEILTPEAMEMIETQQMQMMLSRLNEAVRELTGASRVLPSHEAKATPDGTAYSAQPSAPNDKISDGRTSKNL